MKSLSVLDLLPLAQIALGLSSGELTVKIVDEKGVQLNDVVAPLFLWREAITLALKDPFPSLSRSNTNWDIRVS